MLTQTAALFLDAYRELNAKRMFWIVLALSLFVVAVFALVGINANGLTILWFEIPSLYNTRLIPPAFFYKLTFANLGVGWWLNWFGIVLALVSTAAIYPDFVAGGSVDLYLSKPISRLRLFLTKYLTALLFVALQVLLFAAASFLVIGLRAGEWDARVFLAVPLVLLVFSYLFSVCALLGVLTRSTIASLLLTILFWLLTAGLHGGEVVLLLVRTAGDIETRAYQSNFASLDRQADQLTARVASGDAAAAPELDVARQRRRDLEAKKAASDPRRHNVATAHTITHALMTLLPKTAETNALLSRWLGIAVNPVEEERLDERDRFIAARSAGNSTGNTPFGGGWFSAFRDRTEVRMNDSEVRRDVTATLNARPVSWVLGTSLAFEAVCLSLAAWIFCRRDY